MSNVTFEWSNLEAGYCWQGPQKFMDDIFEKLTGTLPGGTNVITSGDPPGEEHYGDIWVRTNYDGTLEGIYLYSGVWHRPHPIPASGPERMIYRGTPESLKSYDGGVDEPVSPTTGPFWEEDTDFIFRVPVGAGTNPASFDGDPNTVIDVDDTGGAEKVLLDTDTIPEHSHPMFTDQSVSSTGTPGGSEYVARKADSTDAGSDYEYHMQKGSIDPDVGITGLTGAGKYHDNMPPYVGVIFAKRTARQFYTVLP